MKCSRCEHDNPQGARFCEECATPLARICPNCGTALSATAKFCHACAHPVTAGAGTPSRSPDSYTPTHLAEKILTSKAALEGERKHVTVLFADLKGSMELLADRDPEEARKILDPVLELMMEAVHRYEGTVNQVMGDGIMALFGAPVAHEDHAVRACYAALRMQDSIRRHSDGVRRAEGVPIRIRVGLNSGEVVVRAIGSDLHMDYTAVGQTTHLAARMEQLAAPDTIAVTAATLALAEGFVDVKSLGPTPVKGLAEAVAVYEVTGAGPARSRLRAAARRGLTRFVGRDAEVEHLRRVLGQAGAGHGQLVAIVGEAGVGKSRLTYEFTHSPRVQDWLILEASSVSYGKATSYLPVIDLLKAYFKIGDRDDHREMHAKVMRRVLGLDRALEPLLPALLALLDVPVEDTAWQTLDPPLRRQRTLDAFKRLLLRESQVQPLLVVFEDLHWVDGATQALLDSLVEILGSARLLLLVSYRPEYEHRWGGKTAYSQVRLDSLPAGSATELLAALLGADPGLVPLTQMLVKRGNPFFLEETVRTLVETGVLVGERGRYRLVQPVQAIRVPPTVQVMLAARIDRLPGEEKQLLQIASVIGKDVSLTLLQAVAGDGEDAIRANIARLQTAEFIYEVSLFPEVGYTFKHALTQEVAYSSVLHDRRKVLHRKVLEAMEREFGDRRSEHIEAMARHALSGEVWDKAVDYSRESGGKAYSRGAVQESVDWLERALDTIRHLPDTADKVRRAVDVRLSFHPPLFMRGEVTRLLELHVEAERLAGDIPDEARLGQVFARLGAYLRTQGRYAEGAMYCERAVDIGTRLDIAELRVVAGYLLAAILHTRGEYRPAIRLFKDLVEGADSHVATQGLGLAVATPYIGSCSYLAWCFSMIGDFDNALTFGLRGLEAADALGHPPTQVWSYVWHAHALFARGEFELARPLCESAVTISETHGVLLFRSAAYWIRGRVRTRLGRVEDGLKDLERGIMTRGSLKSYSSGLVAAWAEGLLLTGAVKDARRQAEQALKSASETGERSVGAEVLHLLGEIAVAEADLEEAVARLQDAIGLATELGMRPLVAHCHLGLGKLYRRTDKREQAQEHLATATTMYREMGMTYWLEKAEAEMTELGI